MTTGRTDGSLSHVDAASGRSQSWWSMPDLIYELELGDRCFETFVPADAVVARADDGASGGPQLALGIATASA